MLDGIPLLAVTIILIGIFIHIFANLQLTTIRANWTSMRCEPLSVLIAHLVPDGKDPTVDPNKFSMDNFQFCLANLMDASISSAMNPVMGAFNTQVDATTPINESINYLRASSSSLLQPLNSMFQSLWNTVKVFAYQIIRVYRKLHSSFDRIFGIIVSSIFAGLSMIKAIENLLNLVILVIIIIMTILIIMMIFAFYLLFPVMPIIITTLAVISASVFGGSVGGMSDSFCVFPGTLVATADGWKAVEELISGDLLRDGIIEGILKTTGKAGKYVSIGSLKLSESHLIFDIFDKEWKFAKDHTLAQDLSDNEPEYLYCLNTSTRTWIVKGSIDDDVEFTLRDWEELPDDEVCDEEWEKLIFSMLNNGNDKSFGSNPGRGLLGSQTFVWVKTRGLIEISKINVGDFVKDGYDSFTEVIGIYIDSSEIMPRSGPNSAAWIWNPDLEIWSHPEETLEDSEFLGFQLITKSGIFMMGDERIVRDFTEVGADRIHETYSFVKDFPIHW